MPASKKQQLREAIVAVLDRDPGVVALTGRPSENIVAWRDLETATKPCLAYLVVSLVKLDGSADQRRAFVQLTAVTEDDESLANELIAAADAALTTVAFDSLATPLAVIRLPLEETERSHVFDSDTDIERDDLDVVLHITFPVS